MGYVFTLAEFSDKQIPTAADYRNALQMLRAGLSDLSKSGVIYGANIHGSTFHADGGAGSDIDVMVVTESGDAVYRLGDLYRKVKESTRVPVDSVPVHRRWAQAGHHDLDYFYVKYMKTYCRDGIVGADPLAVVAPRHSWADPKQEVAERMEAQRSKLAKQASKLSFNYGERHCDFLERLMRQPVYSAIDLLRLERGNFPAKEGRPLSKAECCRLFEEEFPHLATSDLAVVMDTRNVYKRFLREPGSPAEYELLLGEIGGIYPAAISVLDRNLDFLLSAKS